VAQKEWRRGSQTDQNQAAEVDMGAAGKLSFDVTVVVTIHVVDD
jgi:hypothetical protein